MINVSDDAEIPDVLHWGAKIDQYSIELEHRAGYGVHVAMI